VSVASVRSLLAVILVALFYGLGCVVLGSGCLRDGG
jgi:hypothetical protein